MSLARNVGGPLQPYYGSTNPDSVAWDWMMLHYNEDSQLRHWQPRTYGVADRVAVIEPADWGIVLVWRFLEDIERGTDKWDPVPTYAEMIRRQTGIDPLVPGGVP